MLNEKVSQLLNDQVNKEFYSAYLYLQFSNFYVEQGLAGFANWYKVQAQEERDHAMLMLQYLQNNDVPVTLEAVAKPDAELKANMDPLKAGLAHEQYVTSLIHAIYEAAYEARDFRTMQFLDWFVKEQGEEETNATDLIKKMELFGSEKPTRSCSTGSSVGRASGAAASVSNPLPMTNSGLRRSWKMFSIMLLRASVSFCRAWVRCATRASSSCASCSVRSNCSA